MSKLFTSPSKVDITSVMISNTMGKELEILDLVTEINVYESLYSPILKGSLQIVDAAGVLANLPITGQEVITIQYTRDDLLNEFTFHTTNVTNVENVNDYTVSYIINLVQEMFIRNSVSLVSRAYSGDIKTIAELICEDYLFEILDAEETAGNFKFVIPNWTPIRTLKWLTNRARTSDNVPFVLYNSLMGGLQMRSIKSLFEQPAVTELYPKLDPVEGGANDIMIGTEAYYSEAAKTAGLFYPLEIAPTAEIIQKGAYSSTTMVIDTMNKNKKRFNFDYEEQFNKIPHLGKHSVLSKGFTVDEKKINEYNTTTQKVYAHSGLSFGEAYNDYNGTTNDSVPFLQSFMESINNYRYRIGIPGRFDIEVGSIVDLQINKNKIPDANDPDEWVDKRRSGKHIVTVLRHQFQPQHSRYSITMDVARDTMDLDYD